MKKIILGVLTAFFLGFFTIPNVMLTVEQKPVRYEYRRPPAESVPPSHPQKKFRPYSSHRPIEKPKPSAFDSFCKFAELFANFFGIITGIWFVVELIRKRRTKEA